MVLLTKYEIVTRMTETPSNIVEIAMMLGFMPCFTEPKIAVGRVSTPAPLTKLVMMKSSNDTIKASRYPEIMPGIIIGSRMRVKACRLVA